MNLTAAVFFCGVSLERYLFSDILDARAIIPSLNGATKDEVLREMAVALAPIGGESPDRLHSLFTDRESQASTAIRKGVAVPHIKWEGPFVAGLALSRPGIGFGALDGQSVHLFFLLAAPKARAGEHLKMMARISRLTLLEEPLAALLKETHDTASIMGIIKRLEGGL